ncbi:hypothetical protein B0H17DRAFT_1342370 [Mycena rosella]|uniref:Uncharacterized protein n=1 Tax=Mycena rosella TaxID=1033263 RepID=A0AAD7AX87_MYCRO|nr:hypothetical protein B0H17DRAFT_1342370 [Mycena rosella]
MSGTRARGRGTAPRGHRGGRGGAGGRKSTPAEKRAAPADSDYEEGPAPKKSRGKAATEPLAPIARARRSNAVVHPGLPDAPRPKRTHAQVLEAEAAEVEAASDRARKHHADVDAVAAVDAEQDEAMAEEEEGAVFTLDDLSANAMNLDGPGGDEQEAYDEDEPVLYISQQDFDRVEDDDAYRSSSEYEKPKPKVRTAAKHAAAVVTKRVKKPVKGEIRGEVEEARRKLVAGQAKAGASMSTVKKKGVQNVNAAAASAKAGVSKTWKKGPATASGSTNIPQSPKLGGLTEEDAAAVRPRFDPKARAPRKNEMVVILDSSDAEETPSKVEATAIKPIRVRRTVKVDPGASKIAALGVSQKTPKVKIEASSSLSSVTPGSAGELKALPGFIQSKSWSTRFLPAACRLLLLSHTPMAFATIGTDVDNPGKETVAVIKELLDELYPGNGWPLEWGDVVCARLVSRMGERRSAIGKGATVAVDRAFKSVKYYSALHSDTPGACFTHLVASDAKYAVRHNGPAFYKYPTPEHLSLLDPKHPSYIRPTGFLESQAVIDTISPFLKDENFDLVVYEDDDGNDVVDTADLPVGALAMAAAAVERAYKMYTRGVRVNKPKDFSAINFGADVAGYVKAIRGFKASRWDAVLTAYGCGVSEDDSLANIQSDSLDGVREQMYVPSSPY